MNETLVGNPRAAADMAFESARRQAFFESLVAHLHHRPLDLLPFDAVRVQLGLVTSYARGLHQIPLDKIVGSVGKYQEFNRSFFPRSERDRERWKSVYATNLQDQGLPPIEVYQVGDVYFVIDGNHRVSIARQMGATTIEAYVTEFASPIPLAPDAELPDLILESEKARFLALTRLKELRPEADVRASCPGAYKQLEDLIIARGCVYCLSNSCEMDWEEAVTRWYDEGYRPIVQLIRSFRLLDRFPENTETDLYLWIMEHRQALSRAAQADGEIAGLMQHLASEHAPGRLKSLLRGWWLPRPARKPG